MRFLHDPSTIKETCSYYQQFLEESATMQQVVSSLTSSLKTSLILIPSGISPNSQFLTKEMESIRGKVQGMVGKMKQRMQTDLAVLLQVNQYVGKVSLEFKRLIDLAKFQSERSSSNLILLDHQLRLKDKEIRECQNLAEGDTMKVLEEEWKQQNYVGYQKTTKNIGGGAYLTILKDFRNKVELQINFEKEEMIMITTNIGAKCKEYKGKLVEAWDLISFCEGHKKGFMSNGNTVETRNQEKYTEIEREYLRMEKKIDGFQFDKLNEIKKKLRLLEEADMAESRQYFSYSRSRSRERPNEISEVFGLLLET